ncbi:MAG TPA: type II toxin-antitoxin system VapC family toxin [Nakamurella sp.]
MIVLDASAAVSALLNDGEARRIMAIESVHVPHLIDAEVASGLRRHARSGSVAPAAARAALEAWRRAGVQRYPIPGLLERMWELRENVTSYDACYVALAEGLRCALVTADTQLARATGLRCAVTVVPG